MPTQPEILQKAHQILDSVSPAPLFKLLQDLSGIDWIDHLHQLVLDRYWKNKDIEGVVFLGLMVFGAGQTMLTETDRVPAEHRILYQSTFKAIAYNVASFCWPGWMEPGIVLREPHLELGLRAAKLNMDYAVSLQKGTLAMSNAHWMLGAWAMVALDFEEAVDHFYEAARLAAQAENESMELLNVGYALINRAYFLGATNAPPQEVSTLEQEFIALCENLAAKPDGPDFLQQLQTAHEWLKSYAEEIQRKSTLIQ